MGKIDPNKPVVRTINWGTPVEIAGGIAGTVAAFAGAPRLGGVALMSTGLYDAFNKRKGYGALYGAMGLVLFFLPELRNAVPSAHAESPSLPLSPPMTPAMTVHFTAGSGSELLLSNPGHGTVHVGTRFVIDGAPMSTWVGGTDAKGVVVYADPSAVQQDPDMKNIWTFTGPGIVHFAWGAGAWGQAGELYVQVIPAG